MKAIRQITRKGWCILLDHKEHSFRSALFGYFTRCLPSQKYFRREIIPALDCIKQGQRNGFQSGGAMEHWKVLSATMVGRQEKFPNSRCSRRVKTIIFWPWWQPFNTFRFKTISFFSLSPFFLFATQKSGRAMVPPAPRCRRCRRPC